MSILESLGFTRGSGAGAVSETGAETIRKIARSLEELGPERARYVAAFAYLLSRVAHADLQISDEETATMERIVMERGGLPEEQAVLVVQMAKTQSLLFAGTENFLVTREFNRMANREQKLALLDCLFAVAAAHGGIATVEDNEIRAISKELQLRHADFIDVRQRYKDQLNVLRRPGEQTP